MSRYFVDLSERGRHQIFPGVEVFTTFGEHLLLSLVELQPNSVVEAHQHPHEQLGMLLEGELHFEIGDEQQTVRPGQMWRIPGGIIHRAVAGPSGARAIDVFHPVREEYK